MGKKLLICLVFTLCGILFISGCSTSEETVYDITGSWLFTLNLSSGGVDIHTFTFIGSITSGIVNDQARGHGGTYTVNDTTIKISITFHVDSICGDAFETFSGSFTSPTTMTGSFAYYITGNCLMVDPWTTWQATKL